MAETLAYPEWDATASTPTTICLLTDLCVAMRAKTIVEAGSYFGHFAVGLWNAIVTDPNFRPEFYSADPFDSGWIGRLPDTQRRFAYYRGDFEAMLAACDITDVDVAFIDSGLIGDQSAESGMRYRHYEAAKRVCKPGGLVIVDDVANPWQDVEIVRREATLYLPGERGIAIWRKPSV